jgi:hypothetical protein
VGLKLNPLGALRTATTKQNKNEQSQSNPEIDENASASGMSSMLA